jgi:hypothetical protein
MERRKAAYMLLLIIAIPGLAVPATAATYPIQNFANDLLLILPPVLFILSLIALRQADYEYAFILLLAAVIVTVALAAFEGRLSSFGLFFYNLPVTIFGPNSVAVGSQVTYQVNIGSLPSGWNPYNSTYHWLIYYNSSILVYNYSSNNPNSAYENSNYISCANPSKNSITFIPTQVGTYLVTYSIICNANVSGYPGIASGGAGALLQVTSPPSPWGWITGAIVSAVTGLVSIYVGVLTSAFSFLGQVFFDVLSYALTLPTANGALGNVAGNIYNELLQTSISLSLLFLAGSVAYNALRSYYTDLIDIAKDLFYKIGVWLFFTFGGLEIYNYVAVFINSLIYEIINPYLPLLGVEVYEGGGLLIDLGILSNLIPLGFGKSLGTLVADLSYALIFFFMLVFIRYFTILAIVALIPLLATLWIFEWTRGIANTLVNVLIGLILAGLLNTIIITLSVASGAAWLFILLPFIADLGTIISLILSLVTIKPFESLTFSPAKKEKPAPPPQINIYYTEQTYNTVLAQQTVNSVLVGVEQNTYYI